MLKHLEVVELQVDLVKSNFNLTDTNVSKKEMVCHPVSYFLSYLLKKGVWRDGMPGVIFHFLFAWQIFLQNAMDYEQEINKRESGG